jgi:hypothetical protein
MAIPGVFRKASLAITAALLFPRAGAGAQEYENPPEVLRDAASRGAADIVSEVESGSPASDAADGLDQVWDRLVFYTVADALPGDAPHEVRGLQAYRYLAELGRTDKQLGASSSGPGSTSLAEKPGIPELLALALEHGAIEQSVSGTGLTLSTSPYAFVRLLEPDNAANFDQYGLWRRIGGSVTFDMRSEDPTVGNVDINQVAEWSVRVRVIGDRSTRTKGFTKRWTQVVQPKIQVRLNALSGGIDKALNGSPELRDAADASSETLKEQIAGYLESSEGAPREQRIEAITAMTLSALKTTVFDPISESRLKLSEETFRGITTAMSGLVKAHEDLFSAQQDLGGILDELNRSPLLTVAFTHHTKEQGSAYSDAKLLFETHVAPFDAVVNGFISWYDDPDPAFNQESVRDFGGNIELAGSVKNPFGRSRKLDVVEPILISAAYQLSRLEEANKAIHVAQVKVSIPVTTGVTLPLSVTYASRTDLIDEDEVRGNFGFSLDLDKLYALAHAFTGL